MSNYHNKTFAALMLDEIEDYEQLIDELTNFIEKGVNAGAAYHNRAVAFWEIGQIDEALIDFDSAIRALPNNHMPLQIKGMMLQKLGRIDEAIYAYNEAVKVSGNVATLRRVRAFALMEVGLLADALNDFEVAIQLEPDFKNTIIERDKLKARIKSIRGE